MDVNKYGISFSEVFELPSSVTLRSRRSEEVCKEEGMYDLMTVETHQLRSFAVWRHGDVRTTFA